MKKIESYKKEIFKKLESIYKKENYKSAIIGLNLIIIIVLIANILAGSIEYLGAKSIQSRTLLFYSLAGITLLSVFSLLVFPILKSY